MLIFESSVLVRYVYLLYQPAAGLLELMVFLGEGAISVLVTSCHTFLPVCRGPQGDMVVIPALRNLESFYEK